MLACAQPSRFARDSSAFDRQLSFWRANLSGARFPCTNLPNIHLVCLCPFLEHASRQSATGQLASRQHHGPVHTHSQSLLRSQMVPSDSVSATSIGCMSDPPFTQLFMKHLALFCRIAVATAVVGFLQSMMVAFLYHMRSTFVIDIVVSINHIKQLLLCKQQPPRPRVLLQNFSICPTLRATDQVCHMCCAGNT